MADQPDDGGLLGELVGFLAGEGVVLRSLDDGRTLVRAGARAHATDGLGREGLRDRIYERAVPNG